MARKAARARTPTSAAETRKLRSAGTRLSSLVKRISSPGLRRDTRREIRGTSAASAGFTLLEITLVIVIISIVIMIVLPRLRDTGKAEMQSQAHRLQMIFRLLRSEAVLNGAAYRLNYDLDRESYWVTPDEGTVDLAEFASSFGSLVRDTQIKEPVEIMDVELPMLAGKIAQGQIFTVFYPDGNVDMTVIHIGDGKQAYTLYVNPMNGRLVLLQGYINVTSNG